jgi:hypothetical protein
MMNNNTIDIATPINGIEAIGKVIRALYALDKTVGYKEVSTIAGLASAYTSQALSSARSLGLCHGSGERGKYDLTKAGEEFARALGFGKEEISKQIVRKQILSEGGWSEIVSFLKMNEGKPRDALDLAYHAESRLGKRWSDSMRSHIASAYKSILEYAELSIVEGNNITSQIGMENEFEDQIESLQPSIQSDDLADIIHDSREKRIHSIISKKDYAEFSMPDFFILDVKRTEDAIDFLLNQLKDSSILVPWLTAIKKSIKIQEVIANE